MTLSPVALSLSWGILLALAFTVLAVGLPEICLDVDLPDPVLFIVGIPSILIGSLVSGSITSRCSGLARLFLSVALLGPCFAIFTKGPPRLEPSFEAVLAMVVPAILAGLLVQVGRPERADPVRWFKVLFVFNIGVFFGLTQGPPSRKAQPGLFTRLWSNPWRGQLKTKPPLNLPGLALLCLVPLAATPPRRWVLASTDQEPAAPGGRTGREPWPCLPRPERPERFCLTLLALAVAVAFVLALAPIRDRRLDRVASRSPPVRIVATLVERMAAGDPRAIEPLISRDIRRVGSMFPETELARSLVQFGRRMGQSKVEDVHVLWVERWYGGTTYVGLRMSSGPGSRSDPFDLLLAIRPTREGEGWGGFTIDYAWKTERSGPSQGVLPL